jgi:hypothetical protein
VHQTLKKDASPANHLPEVIASTIEPPEQIADLDLHEVYSV